MSDNIYICKHCDKSFNTKQALGGHVVSHSQEKFKNILQKKENKISEYFKNPKLCLQCHIPLEYKIKNGKFCSRSCGASYNNKRKDSRSEESKQKTRETLIRRKFEIHPPKTNIQFCQCEICNKQFIWNNITKGSKQCCSEECEILEPKKIKKYSKRKQIPKTNIEFCQCEICKINFVWNDITKGSKRFCSKECTNDYISKLASERLKNTPVREKYERGRKSYMEQSFEDWLNTFSLSFQMETHFYNYELKKNYYVDFYFPQFNLVIELDGTQHRNNLEKDKIRDEFLSRVHNLNVVRISHKEFVKKLKYKEICSLLNITN